MFPDKIVLFSVAAAEKSRHWGGPLRLSSCDAAVGTSLRHWGDRRGWLREGAQGPGFPKASAPPGLSACWTRLASRGRRLPFTIRLPSLISAGCHPTARVPVRAAALNPKLGPSEQIFLSSGWQQTDRQNPGVGIVLS